MIVKDLITLLLDYDMEAPVYFDITVSNKEEFDMLAVNTIMELSAEDNEGEPMVILSAEFYNDPTLN